MPGISAARFCAFSNAIIFGFPLVVVGRGLGRRLILTKDLCVDLCLRLMPTKDLCVDCGLCAVHGLRLNAVIPSPRQTAFPVHHHAIGLHQHRRPYPGG